MEHTPPFSEPPFAHRVITTRRPDGSFKQREIFVPSEATRAQHAHMLRHFYSMQLLLSGRGSDAESTAGIVPPTGGLPGARVIDAVLPHRNNRTFYQLDLKDAYANVDTEVLKELFQQTVKNEHEAAYILRFIDESATAPNIRGLPQGAPCSPFLFNFYCRDLDAQLQAFCESRGLVYTRWFDDITVSSTGDKTTLGEGTRKALRTIIESHPGMSINHAKSRLHSLDRSPVTITGVSLYPDGRLQPKPALLRRVFEVFEEIERKVASIEPIDELLLAELNGHHGTLVGMSQEPYNRTMQQAFDRYHSVASLVHNALAAESQPLAPRNPYLDKIAREAIASIDRREYRRLRQELLDDMPDTRRVNDGNWE